MKKQEMIVEITNKTEVSQKVAKDVLIALEEVIDAVVDAQDEVNVCGIKISTKEVEAKEGVVNFGDKAGETWSTPAKRIPVAKFLKSKKDALSVEI